MQISRRSNSTRFSDGLQSPWNRQSIYFSDELAQLARSYLKTFISIPVGKKRLDHFGQNTGYARYYSVANVLGQRLGQHPIVADEARRIRSGLGESVLGEGAENR